MTDVEGYSRNRVSDESRRSTRVPERVLIEVQGITEHLVCTGRTIIVNLHGALILTSVPLTAGMKIGIYVYLTGRRANATIVYVDPKRPLHCGIELMTPRNIWGIALCPRDWHEGDES